jgi:hypothetical protein
LLAANRLMRDSGMSSVVRKPFIIAGVREPIALHLSSIFESWWEAADSHDSLSAELLRRKMRSSGMCQFCDHWFTDELNTSQQMGK